MSDASSTHDSAAASIHACLLDFATASSFADLDLAAVHAARASVASSRFSAEWVSKLRGDALLSYNHATSLRKRALTEPSALSAINHVRALCLAILELGGAMRDMDKGQHAKHWARTGMQFMIGGELDEADRALGAAARLLRETIENESDEMIETELLLKGYQSHLAWARLKRGEGGSMKQVIQHIEDAHAVLEQRAAGVRPRLDSTRLYLAEHCCFRVAGEGYELAELSDAPTDCVERRQLVRLLDLALALLGTSRSTISSGAAARATPAPHGPYDDDSDRSDHRELRDKIARLRSWLFLLDDEVDQATYALNQHSQSPLVSEYIIMRSAILFRSHQPAEASAQTIEFLRAEPDLPHDVTSDAVELLIEHGAFTSALTSINLLSERLVSAAVGAPDGTCALRIGSPASRHFSELQILKFQLLTHEVPDTAAASEHVEALLDGHVNGRAPLEEDTLRVLASKLWKAGCEHYQQGDLHRCVEAMERSYRLLENTSRVAGQVQAMATLSHCYLQQDRLSLAVGRAQHSLKLLADHGLGNGSGVAGGSLAVRASVLLRDGRRFADHDEEDVHGSRAIARIVLVKAKVREGDIEGAHEQVDSLLAANDDTDHLLLAAVCEELVSTGSAYLSASIRILESAAFRSHKALSHASVAVVATTLTDGDNPAAHDSLHATLQLLNFEVALFRDDPNANEILARVAETPGVSTCQLRAVADLAFECGRRELGARALEHTYARLEALEPPPYVDLIDVLRDLIRTSDGRSSALQHFKRALRLFESSSSDCDVPIVPTSEMQWFLTESWNKGVQAFHEDKLEEAESWMAQAFRFSNLSSALQPYREDLNEGYETTIKMITSSRTLSEKGTRRATEWKSRMGRRILEADMDHETRKAAKRPRVSASA